MLIYNHQKEFLGITEDDLVTLGFSNLADLKLEISDFADLFVKTPGYVHNFKHVHWIDFITCAESTDDARVIIRAGDRNFKSILNIELSYLTDEPTKKAYIINLVNLRELSKNENDKVSMESVQRGTPNTSVHIQDVFDTTKPNAEPKTQIIKEENTKQREVTPSPLPETKAKEIPTTINDTPLDLDDFDTNFSEPDEINIPEIKNEETPTFNAPKQSKPVSVATEAKVSDPKPNMYVESLNAGLDYVYDPQVASDELGLPVDLIEEFIEDFIAQAIEFKDDLHKSLDDNDIDHVKVLSHKLKGVAANLRIEDAFEVLSTINTSQDTDEIMKNMNTLYLIIDKLSGKETQVVTNTVEKTAEEKEEDKDDLIFSFKEDDDLLLKVDEPFEVEELATEADDELSLDIKQEDDMPPILDEPFDIDLEDDISLEIKTQEDELLPDIELPDLDDDFITEDISIDNPSETKYCKDTSARDIGIDKASFDELFADYITESQELCAKIKNDIAQGDSSRWKHHAIIIKGMSDNMRVNSFTTELETIIHATDTDIASNAINTIDAKLQQLLQMEV